MYGSWVLHMPQHMWVLGEEHRDIKNLLPICGSQGLNLGSVAGAFLYPLSLLISPAFTFEFLWEFANIDQQISTQINV